MFACADVRACVRACLAVYTHIQHTRTYILGGAMPAKARKEGGRKEGGTAAARISGPVSLYTFEVPCAGGSGSNTVILAGDVHFSEALTCPHCRADAACATLCELIDDLEVRARRTGTSLDVFLEFPYVVGKGRLRDSVVSSAERVLAANAAAVAASPLSASSVSSSEREEAAVARRRHRLRFYAEVAGRAAAHVRAKMEVGLPHSAAPPTITPRHGSGAGVGVFSRLYERFGDRVYRRRGNYSGRRSSSSSRSSRSGRDPLPADVRFHHSDARSEPNVLTLLTPPLPPTTTSASTTTTTTTANADAQKQTDVLRDWIRDYHADVPDARAHRELISAFLFGTDFVRDVARASSKSKAEAAVVREALSTTNTVHKTPAQPTTNTVHKIAKQFHRLEPTAQRPAMRAYLEARLDELTRTLRDIIGYDQVVDLVLAETATATNDDDNSNKREKDERAVPGAALVPGAADLMRDHRSLRVGSHLPNFTYFMAVFNPIVLMDAYLLCRLLRYATAPSSAGGVSFVYAGDAHVDYYLAFFERFLGVRPRVRRPPVYVPELDEFRRCVHV